MYNHGVTDSHLDLSTNLILANVLCVNKDFYMCMKMTEMILSLGGMVNRFCVYLDLM